MFNALLVCIIITLIVLKSVGLQWHDDNFRLVAIMYSYNPYYANPVTRASLSGCNGGLALQGYIQYHCGIVAKYCLCKDAARLVTKLLLQSHCNKYNCIVRMFLP